MVLYSGPIKPAPAYCQDWPRIAAVHYTGINACRGPRASYRAVEDFQREIIAVTRATMGFSNAVRIGVTVAAMAVLAACSRGERPTTELQASQVNAIGVNAYLWRAALETVSFAPLASADSAGGVIVTDWYANPANPSERVKVTVTILDQDLRADALRVAATRQVAESGTWVEAPVQAATVQKLEDIILTKARDLRRKALAS